MGINDREYMRRGNHEDPPRPEHGKLVGIALCVILGMGLLGTLMKPAAPVKDPEIEGFDIERLERMISRTESGPPPMSIRRQVDPNTATFEELVDLPLIGEVIAGSIIRHRPYHALEDLLKVPGMNQTRYEEIRPLMILGKEPVQSQPVRQPDGIP